MNSHTIHHFRIESATITRDVVRIFEAASDVAETLRDVGSSADVALADAFADAPADELHRRASRLRSAALHAASLALELSGFAGRLEQVAALYRAAAPDTADE